QVPLRMAFLIFCGTLLTHLFGGSSGREGAALQIGGSIGGFLSRCFHLDDRDLRILTMCGMSAVFSALFGTPLTAAVFSMEVVSVGVVYYVALMPALVSALIAFGVAGLFGIAPTRFSIPALPEETWLTFLQVIALGALCALVSILLCVSIRMSGRLFRRFFKNAYFRIAAGGILVVVLTLLSGTRDYNGAGIAVIERAVGGSASPLAFLFKLLFTAVTLGCGFKGGEIVPTFFVGATFGCAVGGLIGLPAGFGAALGLIATFCGVVNCPFAAIFLSVELFGSEGLLLFAAACAVSYMLSGRYSLYTSQKIMYSKIKASYIDADAR
ncbi:MAG: chloride channel protein, partial [Oscillospiraceae bacterium]|nr:chloride channel protein [Oscillospiraceae bacterium]